MKTALLVIATGEKYRQYVGPLLESAKRFFVEHDVILWTDGFFSVDATFRFTKTSEGFPQETLHRYHTMLQEERLLRQYDQLFYCDADMRFVAPVGEEVFSRGLTSTLHPGYVGGPGTPERRTESSAFTYNNKAYYCGGFQGGNAENYLGAATTLERWIKIDEANGITAVWHDESHWNSYLTHFERPETVLDPSYCYPENAGSHYTNKWRAAGLIVTPKILALEKSR